MLLNRKKKTFSVAEQTQEGSALLHDPQPVPGHFRVPNHHISPGISRVRNIPLGQDGGFWYP